MKKLCKLKNCKFSTSRDNFKYRCKKCGRASDQKKSLCKSKKS